MMKHWLYCLTCLILLYLDLQLLTFQISIYKNILFKTPKCISSQMLTSNIFTVEKKLGITNLVKSYDSNKQWH